MRETPRTFVGSVVLLLEGPVCPHVAAEVRAEIGRLAGVSHCHVDTGAGTVVVTAEAPVDRTDIVGVLDRLGCRVRA
ncbi:cation-transporting ATPase [Nocardioides guangzhouensis]|uniref:Cation-transporting ATPase n=2 Tax=Nocardioides guangzhouensis TaxID=2497878 RepID=A0A4Q4ZE36_9ACTN|nr:cation-transporting ATPase [Nocardioides guangzhouensis]